MFSIAEGIVMPLVYQTPKPDLPKPGFESELFRLLQIQPDHNDRSDESWTKFNQRVLELLASATTPENLRGIIYHIPDARLDWEKFLLLLEAKMEEVFTNPDTLQKEVRVGWLEHRYLKMDTRLRQFLQDYLLQSASSEVA